MTVEITKHYKMAFNYRSPTENYSTPTAYRAFKITINLSSNVFQFFSVKLCANYTVLFLLIQTAFSELTLIYKCFLNQFLFDSWTRFIFIYIFLIVFSYFYFLVNFLVVSYCTFAFTDWSKFFSFHFRGFYNRYSHNSLYQNNRITK